MTTTGVLFAYAGLLAVAAPRLLTGRWLDRSPRLALALWHAGAASVLLAAALATIVCLTDADMVRHWSAALVGDGGTGKVFVALSAIVVPGMLVGRVCWVGARTAARRRAARRRHLELVDLLGRHDSRLDVTVIPAEAPAAYCVPQSGRIVLTEGALALLEGAELGAVLAHERAHLAGRHGVLVAWADLLGRAFPRLPLFGELHRTTAHLVELLADDQTARRQPADRLATAIAALSCGPAPAVGLAASGGSVLARVERLLAPPPPLPVATRIGGAGAAVSLLVLPVLLVAVFAAGMAACPYLFS